MRRHLALLVLAVIAIFVTSSCVNNLTLSPSKPSVATEQSVTFTASFSSRPGVTVAWMLTQSGSSTSCAPVCGFLTAMATPSTTATSQSVTAVYTAPASVPTSSNVTLTVTVTDTDQQPESATSTITITQAGTSAPTVSLAPASATFTAGSSTTQAFAATVTQNPSNQPVAWSLVELGSNPANCSASSAPCGTLSNLTATGVTYTPPSSASAAETVLLIATPESDTNISAASVLTINSGTSTTPPATLSISPTAPTATAGGTAISFTASLNGTAATSGITWVLSQGGAACATNTCGTLSSASSNPTSYTPPSSIPTPSTVTISASSASPAATASTTITVVAPTLQSIAVTPTGPSIQVGQTQTFTATGTYSNSTTQPLTTGVTWGSSSQSIATISSSGVATGVAAGQSYITATVGGVSSPATAAVLTVTPVQVAPPPATGFSRYLFEVNGDQSISTYAVVQSTGQLRSLTYNLPYPGGSPGPMLAALNPKGNAIYTVVPASTGQDFVSYTVNQSGFLSEQATFGVPSTDYTTMVVDPLGRYLWIFDNATSPGSILVSPLDPNTGAAGTQATAYTLTAASVVEIMVVDPTGSFLFTEDQGGNITAYVIGASGTLTPLGAPPTSHPFANTSMVVDPSSKFLYAMDSSSLGQIYAYTISGSNGLTPITGSPFLVSNNGEVDGQMVINPTTTFLYAVDTSSPTSAVDIFSISATGALTQVTQTVALPSPGGAYTITMDPSGLFLYVGFDEAHEIWTYGIAQSGATAGQLTPNERIRMRLSRPYAQLLSTGSSPVTFTPQALYVTNSLSNDVAEFSIGATGALTSVGTVAAGTNPLGIAVTPNGEFAYAADSTEAPGTVSAYGIANDTLTSLGPVVNTGAYPNGLITDLSGSFLYTANAADADIWGFQIGANGTISGGAEAGSTGTSSAPLFVATEPTGLYLYSANSGTATVSAFAIQLPSGTLASVGTPISAGAPTSGSSNGTNVVTIDPTGRFLYATAPVSNSISEFSIAASTGALTALSNPYAIAGPSSAEPGASSVVVVPAGTFAYATNQSLNQIFAFTIDPTTGILADLHTSNPDSQAANTGTTPVALAVDPSGQFLFCVNSGSNDIDVYTINSDGTLTMVGATTIPSGGTMPTALVVTGTVQ
jgi:6-phosphogluconolactonase (cycloisomerase 2 family)